MNHDLTKIADFPAFDTYQAAVEALANGLVRVWQVCEDTESGNLPEALSYALGLASMAIEVDEDLGADDCEWAAGKLVRHRPGSWEAQHVAALVYDPGAHPAGRVVVTADEGIRWTDPRRRGLRAIAATGFAVDEDGRYVAPQVCTWLVDHGFFARMKSPFKRPFMITSKGRAALALFEKGELS